MKEGYTFDDVLLVPQYSTVSSRKMVDLQVLLPKNITTSIPVMPANMQDVVGESSIPIFLQRGCLSIIHRFNENNEDHQISFLRRFPDKVDLLGCSIGVKEQEFDSAKRLIEAGFKVVCIDVAHGDSLLVSELVHKISESYPEILLIAGNVATARGAERLWKSGADIVKVGVGPGSICTTRKETGNGYPQLSALMDVNERRNDLQQELGRQLSIISDGGIKSAGDCVKALCFSDLVMIGGMFAGTIEAPGKKLNLNGETYKEYRGSSTLKPSHVEGAVVLKTVSSTLDSVLDRLQEGIRSGCSYQGCHSVDALKDNPEFIKVSSVQRDLDHNKETFRG